MPKGKRKSDTEVETKVKRSRKKKDPANGDDLSAAAKAEDNAYDDEEEYEEIVSRTIHTV